MPTSIHPASFRTGVAFGVFLSLVLWATIGGGADAGLLNMLLRVPGMDKVGHVVVYGTLTALAILGAGDRRILRFVPLWPSVFLTLSMVDEFRQRTVPGRDFSREDMLANLIGVTLGWMVAVAATRSERSAIRVRESSC